MRRRDFIALLGSAAALGTPVARAQQPAVPTIGWLSGRSAAADVPILRAFRQGLNARGYSEGSNLSIEYRWADGRADMLPELAVGLVRLPVAVVVASGSFQRSRAQLGTTIPIVFVTGGDPVKEGIVSSLSRPGGNLTGVTTFQRPSTQKRLQLLHEFLPRATSLAILVNQTEVVGMAEATDLQQAAGTLGLPVRVLSAETERDIDSAIASLAQIGADALYVAVSPLFLTYADQIVALAARVKVPTCYYREEFAYAGGLMSYGSSTEETYVIAGDYTGRILKGTKPGDLPVQQPTKFKLIINLKTAKSLGLTVPGTVLALADEVIE